MIQNQTESGVLLLLLGLLVYGAIIVAIVFAIRFVIRRLRRPQE